MHIGLFGGTFDPIHYGHLRSAEEVREAFGLDEIWFIPTAYPPHKDTGDITPFHHRLAMTRLAVNGVDYFKVLDIEAKRNGPSYSIDTLRELSGLHPDKEFYFILGSDAFASITSWKEYWHIPEFTSIVVMGRKDGEIEEVKRIIARTFRNTRPDGPGDGAFMLPEGKGIYLAKVTHIEISSTKMRELLINGRSIRFLLPHEVTKYISANDLYRDEAMKLAVELANEVANNKGEEVVILNLRGLSDFTSFFVIAHGRSARHIQGMADNILEVFAQKDIHPLDIEGKKEAKWILMDYGEVVVHLFYEPMRAFYDLEGLWSQAKRQYIKK
ncbi:MAG: nicotinate (nicotinamide) nucleotide adenylyltransferase [Dissulfurimicrobium hydrothermale]|uniref:nicotinate (nicotinamide) nucleotide adenylyltransferase n=1 Tax=Dissulfurimicrobium hydrothermale TaxID=1750598 RepID=UPI003C77C01C